MRLVVFDLHPIVNLYLPRVLYGCCDIQGRNISSVVGKVQNRRLEERLLRYFCYPSA